MKTFWISFASSPTATTKSVNLGCCMVDANSESDALAKTVELKINPGGNVVMFEIPVWDPRTEIVLKTYEKNRLIPRAELLAKEGIALRDLPVEEREDIYSNEGITVICEDCNRGFPHKH